MNVYDRVCNHSHYFLIAIHDMGSWSVKCNPADVHTNIAIVHLSTDVISPEQFCKRLSVVSTLLKNNEIKYF